jgi:hypothetical protein
VSGDFEYDDQYTPTIDDNLTQSKIVLNTLASSAAARGAIALATAWLREGFSPQLVYGD